ncbi:MAG TPA: HAD family hydrolase, partial [Treponema sp.]|nr:HAD family hydrolase [Treponema sp.]
MREQIDAVAFDIDGTLYPNAALYWRTIPFFLRNHSLVLAFGRVRKEIRLWQEAHPGEIHTDFFGWQASLMAEQLGGTPDSMKIKLHELIYEGWKP